MTAQTRVLLVNAPNNPTGWTLSRAEQQVLLDHCGRTGTWIIADESTNASTPAPPMAPRQRPDASTSRHPTTA